MMTVLPRALTTLVRKRVVGQVGTNRLVRNGLFYERFVKGFWTSDEKKKRFVLYSDREMTTVGIYAQSHTRIECCRTCA